MKLDAEWRPYRVALTQPLLTSAGTVRERRGWILALHDGDGARGLGEAAPIHWTAPHALAATATAISRCTGVLDAPPFEDAGGVARWVDGLAVSRRLPAEVAAALQAAALDGLARRRGVAVAALLTGEIRAEVAVNALVSAVDPDELRRQARRLLAAGARCIKLKVGTLDPAREISRISALIDAVDPRTSLRLDANRGWGFDAAREILAAVDCSRIDYIEEPLSAPSRERLARLRSATAMRIAIDESLEELGGLDAIAAASCCDAVVLKPACMGGVLRALESARRAHAYGLDVTLTDAIETPVGQAAVVHLAAALGDRNRTVGLGGRLLGAKLDVDLAALPAATTSFTLITRGPGLVLAEPAEVPAMHVFRSSPRAVELAPVESWWLGESARRFPSLVALTAGGESITYAELASSALACARRLASAGVTAGDRVAVLATPRRELVELIHAVAALGAVVHPLSLRAIDAETTRQVVVSRPRLVVADEAHASGAAAAAEACGAGLLSLASRAGARASASFEPAARDASVSYALLSTSGTSGEPKGVQLTRRSVHSSAVAAAERLGFAPGQTWLCTLPLHHVGGLSMLIRAAIFGAGVVLRDRFEPASFCDDLVRFSITHASVVPTMLHRLLASPEATAAEEALARCQWLVGGAELSEKLAAEAHGRGLDVRATYGLTEASSQVATCERGELAAHPGTVGRPLGGIELAIAAPDRDGIGEIVVTGPQLFSGYVGDAADARTRFHDDRLRTGDLGRVDGDGRLYFCGRLGDVIVSGGENIAPREVEAVLEAHPAVSEAGVFGESDPEWGQRVVAIVVPYVASRIESAELLAWCRERLAGFKVPKRIEVADSLPRNPNGKLARATLARK